MDNFLSQKSAAKHLGVTVKTIIRYRRKGHLKPLELGSLVLYPIHELEQFKATYEEKRGREMVVTAQ